DAFELLEEALLHWEKSSADVKPTAALKNCAAAVVLLDGSQDIHPALVDSVWRHFDMLEADILEGMHEPAILNDMALLTELRMWLDRLRHQLDELRKEVRRNDKERADIGSSLAQLAH